MLADRLPKDWEMRSISSLGEVVTGTTPRTSNTNYYGGDIPFVSPADVGVHRHIVKYQSTLTSAGASHARLLPAGAILVTGIGVLGKIGQAGKPLATNQQINSLIPGETLDPAFGYWVVHLLERQLLVEAGLQVVPIVNKSTFSRLSLPLPPLREQRRIAEILDTADRTIEETEALISKLQQTKTGLVHDLLTRGLDKRGHLRDPHSHPEQFKDSPLGRLPSEWEIGRLEDYYAVPARNGLYKPAAFYGKGPLMIHMPQMFRDLTIDVSEAARVQVSSVELDRYGLRSGDLVFARRSLNLEGAGKCSLVSELPEPTTFESSIIRVRLDSQRLTADFSVVDPYRMMRRTYGPAEGSTQPLLHAWRVWVNINAIRCKTFVYQPLPQ